MGTSPKGDTYNTDGRGLPLLNGPTEFGLHHPNCTVYTTDSKRQCECGDLIFCVRGSTTGRMNWADRPYSLGRGVCAIRGKTPLDTKFIRCTIDLRLEALLKLSGGGSTFPNLTGDDLKGFPLPFPEYRHTVASILSAYDDLIENNVRRIEILEEMAKMIYREWFVNFRFPGHEKVKMVESALGKVPTGWKVCKVKQVLKRLSAGTVYTEGNVSGSGLHPIVDQSKKEFLGFHSNSPDLSGNPDSPIAIFGDHTCKMRLMMVPFSVGANVVPFVTDADLPMAYVFFLVRDLTSTSEYKRHWSELTNKAVVIGEKELAVEFSGRITPILELSDNLIRTNLFLRQTRDLLLPKLISGEINVENFDTEAVALNV
jgi:restriction endonuclease S subunit